MSIINWRNTIKINKNNGDIPLYIVIYNHIRDLIQSKELTNGYRLPPIRAMANELSVNNGTVARAYRRLEQDGWIKTQVGRGTFVCEIDDISLHINLQKKWESVILRDRNDSCDMGNTINFAASTPSPELFPVDYFKEAMNYVLDRDGGRAFGYHDAQGYYPLREAVSEYLKLHDVFVSTGNIQITTGAQQGIDIIAKALIKQGDVVYMERPSYSGAIGAFSSRGAVLVDVPMDREGMDINVLENMVRKKNPAILYIMPNYQSPTGLCYSKKRRKELLNLADKYGFWIMEDDYMGELNFYGAEHKPIKAFDSHSRVVYVKSFSKLFMPGIRLGFIVFPEKIYNQIQDAKRYTDISTAGLTQRAFDLYLRCGEWKKYLEYLKGIFLKRHDCLKNALYAHRDIFEYVVPNGGLTYWISYKGNDKTSMEISQLAIKRGLRIVPGEIFYIHNKEYNKLRLGYADVHMDDIKKGIDILSDIVGK